MKKKIETRRMLLFLPLLVLPLMAGAFYLLGGGQDKPMQQEVGTGINIALPDAKFGRDSLSGKMEAYELAEKAEKNTGYSSLDDVANRLGFDGLQQDPQTLAIEEKLNALNREMNRPYDEPKVSGGSGVKKSFVHDETERLEKLMKSMYSENGEDQEMTQLSGMLQRIQEIQDPELARLKYKSGLKVEVDSQFSAIPAVIDGNQKAVQGSVIKLKLLDTMVIGRYRIPKGYSIYALGSFSNQRLNLEVKNIRVGHSIIPVRLTVFDQKDAMVGVNAPEALLADAVRGGGVDAMGSFEMMGMDLTTQLAGAGIDAAKGLLSKKMKRIRQPLKNGYPVLLRLEKN